MIHLIFSSANLCSSCGETDEDYTDTGVMCSSRSWLGMHKRDYSRSGHKSIFYCKVAARSQTNHGGRR